MDRQTAEPQQTTTLAGRAVALPFWFYKRLVSPAIHSLGMGQCLYRPTCSEYAYVAVARFGPLRGGWLALGRILRCHPWARGGFDPVPDRTGGRERLP